MQTLSGNERPDLSQLWWTCLLYCSCHGKCIFADPLQMPHTCHGFWKCPKTLTFCSLLTRCTIPCACHAKLHLNLQKWSEPLVFLTIWLRNVLRTATACALPTSQLPKVVRSWCALNILISKCASCHDRVQFFISHLASWLRTRRFSEPTFRPSGATNHYGSTGGWMARSLMLTKATKHIDNSEGAFSRWKVRDSFYIPEHPLQCSPDHPM